MNLSWLESIIFGFISGLTEFLPVSSKAHRTLLLELFGAGKETALTQLIVHAAILVVLLQTCNGAIQHLNKERKLLRTPKRRRTRQPDARAVKEMKLLRTTAIPMVIGLIILSRFSVNTNGLHFLAFFWILNGVLLYFPTYISKANKDARSMSPMDGVLTGISGMLSAFPGISRIAVTSAAMISRGADWHYAGHFCLLLSIPAMIALIILDVAALIAAGIGTISLIIVMKYLLIAAGTYFGAFYGVQLLRFLTAKGGFVDLSYYCWGMALFSFILYLVT